MFIVQKEEPIALTEYLRNKGWMHDDEDIVLLEKPGEGNMNYVLRVGTGSRTFIIKQSRPYVVKYPQVAAPLHRIQIEAAFYQKINSVDTLRNRMPQCIGFDESNHILMLEDLGTSTDFTFLYKPDTHLSINEQSDLLSYLSALHQSFVRIGGDPEFVNADMKRLNHEHIFIYPFLAENGFNLDAITPGLQQYAMKFKSDSGLKKRINDVGAIYLAVGDHLLHGDFYPGSWLQTNERVRVIDPEFSFYGPREFDLGVWKAHLILSLHEVASIDRLSSLYDSFSVIDINVLNKFAGIEIMRRLIGLAQLPLFMEFSKKMELLDRAYQMIKE